MLVHTHVEVETGAIHVKKYEPQDWSYKTKVHKFTPEEEAILKRWREEARQRAYEKLRERDSR